MIALAPAAGTRISLSWINPQGEFDRQSRQSRIVGYNKQPLLINVACFSRDGVYDNSVTPAGFNDFNPRSEVLLRTFNAQYLHWFVVRGDGELGGCLLPGISKQGSSRIRRNEYRAYVLARSKRSAVEHVCVKYKNNCGPIRIVGIERRAL